MLEFLKLGEACRLGAEERIGQVVSKCLRLSARSQWNSQAASMFTVCCSTEELVNPCLSA